MTEYCHFLFLCPRNCSHGVAAGFMFGGKENTGDGTPEGLPLIIRFSYLCSPAVQLLVDQKQLAPSLRWRTLILVTPRDAGPCAVFPGEDADSPPFVGYACGIITDKNASGWTPA
jgi:hypothetical protein